MTSQTGEPFDPSRYRKKSTRKDYAIYIAVVAVLAAVIAGGFYFFTRSKAEQDRLRAKIGMEIEPKPTFELRTSKAETLMEEAAPAAAPAPAPAKFTAPAVASSTYSGASTRLIFSKDPALPQPSPAFVTFAQELKVSAVVQGPPARLMLGGRPAVAAGKVIDESLGVTFVGLDIAQKTILLRDVTGAELRVGY